MGQKVNGTKSECGTWVNCLGQWSYREMMSPGVPQMISTPKRIVSMEDIFIPLGDWDQCYEDSVTRIEAIKFMKSFYCRHRFFNLSDHYMQAVA